MNYILYKQSGEIVCNLNCEPADLDINIAGNNAYAAIAGRVEDTSISFIEDKKVRALPTKPERFATFDYVNKLWITDVVGYTQEAQKERAKLLAESDWTQLPDIPLATKSLWQLYRQSLRDITNQGGYPVNVIWPIKPNI